MLEKILVNHENICSLQIKIWRANDIFILLDFTLSVTKLPLHYSNN